MDTNTMFGFMDFIMVGAAAYLIYAWYLLAFKGEIKEGVLVPQGMARRCKDIEGYKKFVGPKLLTFSIGAAVTGGLGLFSDYVHPINSLVYLGCIGVFLVILIWFVTQTKKAQNIYFYS